MGLLELAIRNHSKRAAVALLLTVATLTPSVLLRPLARVTRSRALLSGMAWRSSGASNEELVSNLHRNGVIESQQVRQAMLGGDRATISAPHMHASACDSLLPYLKDGSKVLDIGSGSGYLTHVLAELVKPSGTVIGIDHIQALTDMAIENTQKSSEGRLLLETGAIRFVTGDGRKGYSEGAPYGAIHVGAAAAEHHKVLEDQLKAP